MQGFQAGNYNSYSVVITNLAGKVTSSNAYLTVIVPPTVIAQPQSRNIAVGNNVTFSVGVNGTAPFAYQWLTNGVPDTSRTNSN